MAKAKREKIDHVKFDHKSLGFVSVQGSAAGSNDYDLTVLVSDGESRLNLFLNPQWEAAPPLALLKMYQEGINKAIEFITSAAKMPAAPNVWSIKGINSINKQTEEKIRAKKPAAKAKFL
jgi:hypothetical protein